MGCHAAVVCPVVMLHRKLASENVQLQKDHVASYTDTQIEKGCAKICFIIEFKSDVDMFRFYAHGSPTVRPIVQAENVPSSF